MPSVLTRVCDHVQDFEEATLLPMGMTGVDARLAAGCSTPSSTKMVDILVPTCRRSKPTFVGAVQTMDSLQVQACSCSWVLRDTAALDNVA